MVRGENLTGRRLLNAGRKTGSENKLTVNLKTAVEEAFDQLGGIKWLVRLGKRDPATFCSLLGKLLPKAIEVGGTLKHEVDFRSRLEEAIRRSREEEQEAVRPEQVC